LGRDYRGVHLDWGFFVTKVRPLRHPIAVFIATVLVVMTTGVGIVAATGNAALVPSTVWPSVLATIAGEQAFTYSVAPPGTVSKVNIVSGNQDRCLGPHPRRRCAVVGDTSTDRR
jgi:hypothetical protein